jgi:hypothetical protein
MGIEGDLPDRKSSSKMVAEPWLYNFMISIEQLAVSAHC